MVVASGTWTTTSGRAIISAGGVLVLGLGLLGAALWPVLVALAGGVVWLALTLWSLLPIIAAIETVVLVNMRLDWLSGQWQIVRWRTAWALAHWTMLIRGRDLAVWYARSVWLQVTEARRIPKVRPVAAIGPAPLFVVARDGETTQEAA